MGAQFCKIALSYDANSDGESLIEETKYGGKQQNPDQSVVTTNTCHQIASNISRVKICDTHEKAGPNKGKKLSAIKPKRPQLLPVVLEFKVHPCQFFSFGE